MASMAAVAAALVLLLPLGASASIVLPAENDRHKFREDIYSFWGAAEPLTGKSPMNDMVLHSQGSEPLGSAKWDLLYPSTWERAFDSLEINQFCRNNWWASYVAAVLYLMGVRGGQIFMQDRKALDLRGLLNAWNLFLATFSFVGMCRVVPHLLMLLKEYGFEYTVCRAAAPMYGNGPVGLWVVMFIFSKYIELIDTVFMIVRKRAVGFLHWYHHFTVLLYCWHAYVWQMPTGIYFVSMNYSVHAIMYFYYFLAGVGKPPRWALMVTILQLAQMFVGSAVTVSHIRILVLGSIQNCDGYVPNLVFALLMYASYFYLFCEFLVKRYCLKPKNGSSKKAGKASNGVHGSNGVNGTNGVHGTNGVNGTNGSKKEE